MSKLDQRPPLNGGQSVDDECLIDQVNKQVVKAEHVDVYKSLFEIRLANLVIKEGAVMAFQTTFVKILLQCWPL